MKRLRSILCFALAASARLCAADDAAIIDGPNYAFTIAAPQGWKLTSTSELQAALHPVDAPFENSPVIMYARSADKAQLGVTSIAELNRLDLDGIHGQNPAVKSEKLGTAKTALGTELPLYSFSGGGYSEVVAYAEHAKTITVIVLSADTDEQLKAARPAFNALVASYVFLTDTPANSKKKKESVTK